MMKIFRTVLLLALASFSGSVIAYGGDLNAQGCHNDRNVRAGTTIATCTTPRNNLSDDDVSIHYANCSAARAAGAAPVRRGEPGYASHLDRDNDGVGCE